MLSSVTRQVLRQILLALYVLAIVLPVSVQSGVQLEPSPEYAALQDIEKSRCLGSGDAPASHDDMTQCCTLCASIDQPRNSAAADARTIEFPSQHGLAHADTQTQGLLLGLNQRPPPVRGPPLSSQTNL